MKSSPDDGQLTEDQRTRRGRWPLRDEQVLEPDVFGRRRTADLTECLEVALFQPVWRTDIWRA